MYLAWRCVVISSCFLTTLSKHFLVETEDKIDAGNPDSTDEYDEDDEYADIDAYDDYSNFDYLEYEDSYDYYDTYDYEYDYWSDDAIESKNIPMFSCKALVTIYFLVLYTFFFLYTNIEKTCSDLSTEG